MLGSTCQAVSSFPTFAPCLEHVCVGGGGCSVANEGLGLYIGGDYSLHLKCYVTCTICQQTSCHGNTLDDNVTLDMRTRIRPADWCAAARSLPVDGKPASLVWQLALSDHQERNICECEN